MEHQKHDKLVFIFEYERGKPVEFNYKITRGDYEAFWNIVDGFFTDEELDDKQLKKLFKVYPNLKKSRAHSLNEIFDSDMEVNEISTIGKNKYKISWSR